MGKNRVINVPTARLKWTGHKATVEIVRAYEATASQAETHEEAEEIRALRVKLARLDHSVLHVMAHDDEPIAPRVGKSSLPETTLKALANFELGERERKRSDRKWLISNIASWALALIGISVAIYLALNK